MFRRLVVCTLLPLLLLTRTAAFGHAHAFGTDLSFLRPHIHLSGLFPHSDGDESDVPHRGHHHGHDHHEGQHHHDHLKVDVPLPPHDDDAVEIVVDDALDENACAGLDWTEDACPWLMPALFDSAVALHAERSSACRGHPPPGAGRCPLHLLLLVLVI